MLANLLKEQARTSKVRREETWERCILAERLRKRLLRAAYLPFPGGRIGGGVDPFVRVGKSSSKYVQEMNKNFSQTKFSDLDAMSQRQREEYFNSERLSYAVTQEER